MGFLDHTTNNIIVDAVLTDKGREKLARAEGLKIMKYAFADTEVDYTILQKYGEIVGREKIEKNTPIFEANTANHAANRHKLLTDGTGGTIETISVAAGSYLNGVHKFNVTFRNFSANQTISYDVYFTSKKWSLTSPSATAVPVGDATGLLSVASLTATMGSDGSLVNVPHTFTEVSTLTSGTEHNASFEIVEDGGASSSSSSANTHITFTVA